MLILFVQDIANHMNFCHATCGQLQIFEQEMDAWKYSMENWRACTSDWRRNTDEWRRLLSDWIRRNEAWKEGIDKKLQEVTAKVDLMLEKEKKRKESKLWRRLIRYHKKCVEERRRMYASEM